MKGRKEGEKRKKRKGKKGTEGIQKSMERETENPQEVLGDKGELIGGAIVTT